MRNLVEYVYLLCAATANLVTIRMRCMLAPDVFIACFPNKMTDKPSKKRELEEEAPAEVPVVASEGELGAAETKKKKGLTEYRCIVNGKDWKKTLF